jgi:pimeloyl-ACP methyl ester carboxylesterase
MKALSITPDKEQRIPIRIIVLALLVAIVPSYSHGYEASAISFSSADGVPLKGHLFGSGKTGVILAHMYPTDQRSWFALAQKLATEGCTAMTFDFRGYGESGGNKEISQIDRDLEAAYLFLKPKVERIFLIGASMGGTASVRVASRQPVDGVVCISGPVSFSGLDAEGAIGKVKAPCLFIAAEKDPGQAASSARHLHSQAQCKKDLLILSGSEHGTFLLQGPHKEQVEKRILEFLRNP